MCKSPHQVATAAGKWKHGGGSVAPAFRRWPGAVLDLPGRRMTLENESIVAVRPQPRVIHRGNLSPGDERQVFAWVVLNEAALIAYWDFTINTSEFLARLQQLPP